jgi:hypothetical protein
MTVGMASASGKGSGLRGLRHSIALGLLWLVPGVTALDFWRVWDQLPDHMAVHFEASGRANGWMSPADALKFALEAELFMLLMFTIASMMLRIQKPRSAWPTLVVFAFVLGAFAFVNHRLVIHNVGLHVVIPGVPRI